MGGGFFGISVALSGDTLLAGAVTDIGSGSLVGSVYVFVRSGSSWIEQASLSSGIADNDDFFGYSVAISGDTALIGAPTDSSKGGNAGAAYIFDRRGSSWSDPVKIIASEIEGNNHFGQSVALSGDIALVGAPSIEAANIGAAYIFVRESDVWSEQSTLNRLPNAFGYSVAVSGDMAVVGRSSGNEQTGVHGSAYIFVRSDGTWTQDAQINSNSGDYSDKFGTSVAISDGKVLVGAPDDDSVHTFERCGSLWEESSMVTAAERGTNFGWSVAISRDAALAGAYLDGDSGAAYAIPQYRAPCGGDE